VVAPTDVLPFRCHIHRGHPPPRATVGRSQRRNPPDSPNSYTRPIPLNPDLARGPLLGILTVSAG